MKAARVHQPGPPDVIVVESIDVPEPREQEVLVRVRAAGVGPWDALVRTGNSGLPQTCSMQISRTALSCLLHPKAYGTYPAGATFGGYTVDACDNRATRGATVARCRCSAIGPCDMRC